ncbi:glyoxylate reductase [Anaerosphaera aminiphila DSM 21120]|uniref:Glyoxylate reductase n=1 Tax=Anaerosphaera aminiphila DSM 21120 TaxID=1120995 RepID=A0A1M5TKG9_9FIRM|nr:2-hydroxyacid dehydrogenase family protein [Anaerosphaera aminiphila]SHH51176.1 glyoxylate reductase [Anaerosphaera aminiphila DSM 21120]
MKVFITSTIPDKVLKLLEGKFELNYNDSLIPLSKEEIIKGLADAEALVCPLSDKIDAEVINSSKNLKLICNYGAGFDNIDINTARDNGIIVTNAPAPSSAVSTAELAFSLILALSRNLINGDKFMRREKFYGWRPTFYLGSELRGKTLGIIGMGNIGKNVAKRAIAFEMNVIYYSRNRKEDIEKLGAKYADIKDVIKNSDFISLHSAFAPELKHLISNDEFDMMKESAFLINTARGPLVEEKALIKALKEHKIRGAALDVYEFEPKFSKELIELDNVVLEPHIGNATFEAREEMGVAVANNLLDYSENKIPRNKVN